MARAPRLPDASLKRTTPPSGPGVSNGSTTPTRSPGISASAERGSGSSARRKHRFEFHAARDQIRFGLQPKGLGQSAVSAIVEAGEAGGPLPFRLLRAGRQSGREKACPRGTRESGARLGRRPPHQLVLGMIRRRVGTRTTRPCTGQVGLFAVARERADERASLPRPTMAARTLPRARRRRRLHITGHPLGIRGVLDEFASSDIAHLDEDRLQGTIRLAARLRPRGP